MRHSGMKQMGTLAGLCLALVWGLVGQSPQPAAAQAGNGVDVVGHLGGAFTRVQSVGGLAYVVAGYELAIVDVSDPATPQRLGYVTLATPVVDVAVNGTNAFVLSDRLYWIDVSTPASPRVVTDLPLDDTPQALTVAGGMLYILTTTADSSRLTIIHAAAETFTPVGALTLSGQSRAVVVDGPFAYLANHERGLQIVSLSNPGAPTLVSTLSLSGAPRALAMHNQRVYVAQETCSADCLGYLTAVDVSVAGAPVARGTATTAGQAWDVAVSGAVAYVLDSAENLTILSLNEPDFPTVIGLYHTPGIAHQIALAGNYAYVADGPAGLTVLDVTTPQAPVMSGHLPTVATVLDIAVQGNLAYLAAQAAGLAIVDVAAPAQPKLLAHFDTPGLARAVAVAGKYAYVADARNGLRIIDVTLPAAPVEVSAVTLGGYAYDVALRGAYAYVADVQGGLHIVDVGDPDQPAVVGFVAADNGAWSITLAGERAYLTDGTAQVHILNLSNPTAPTPLGIYRVEWLARDVAVSGNVLYVADDYAGLHVVDITNPALPRRIGLINNNQLAFQVETAGAFVYMANWTAGLRIYDATQVTKLTEWKRLDTMNFNVGVSLANGLIFAADSQGGLLIAQERFQITGSVRQANGLPSAGVLITLDGGQSLPTNPTGNYTFNEVRVGAHTLVPTAVGYQFSPASRQLNLPGRTADQDFVILPEAVSAEITPGVPATLTYNDTQGLPTTLSIPAGAVDEPLTLSAQPLVPAAVGSYLAAAHALQLSLSRAGAPIADYTFLQPLMLSITYSAADLAGRDEADLLILWHNGATWVEATTNCAPPVDYLRNPAADSIALPICRPGRYQLATFVPTIYLPIVRTP